MLERWRLPFRKSRCFWSSTPPAHSRTPPPNTSSAPMAGTAFAISAKRNNAPSLVPAQNRALLKRSCALAVCCSESISTQGEIFQGALRTHPRFHHKQPRQDNPPQLGIHTNTALQR